MPKYTIMRKNMESYQALDPMRNNSGDILFFDTPDAAYQYYRTEHYWETADIYLVQFHDFELKLVEA